MDTGKPSGGQSGKPGDPIAQTLVASDRLLLEILRQLPTALTIQSADGHILECSDAFCTETGFAREEIIGRDTFEIGLWADSSQRLAMREALQRDGSVERFEFLSRHRDGSETEKELSIRYLDSGGERLVLSCSKDIAVRKAAVYKLQRSEGRYRALVENSPVCIHEIDSSGRLMSMNAAGLGMMGANDERLIRELPYLDVVGDCDRPRIARLMKEAFEGQKSEFDFQSVSGQQFHSSFVPIKDEMGKVQRLMGLSTDITQRRQAQARLLETLKENSELRLALDEHAIVLTTDVNGRITSANEKFCAVSGYSSDELIGRDYRIVGFGGRTEEFRHKLLKDIKANRAWHGELETRSKDGSVHWMDTTIMPFLDEHGAIRQYVVICRDITERRESAVAMAHMTELLERTGELADIGGWEIDVATMKQSWTAQAFRIKDMDSAVEPSVEEALDMFAPEVRPIIAAAVKAAIDFGTPYDLELPVVSAKGRRGWVNTQGFAERTDGKTTRLFGTIQDITKRKQAEQTQQTLLREKVALLKEVHHRVKNNLQVITSLLRLESRNSAIPETRAVLRTMQGRIQTMAQLHESLYRSGTLATVDLGVYLGKLCRQIFEAHSTQSGLVKLRLEMGSVHVDMDLAANSGLLVNELVSNSLKHAFPDDSAGEVVVELRQSQAEGKTDGSQWCLLVSDTGVGLPPDFDDKRDTSLGLQLVDDLSQQIGGTLEVDSPPGGGSVFAIRFEAHAPEALVMPP